MPQSKLTNVRAMGKRGRSLEADRQASTLDALKAYKAKGIQIVAPPIFALLTVENEKIAPSAYAKNIRKAGLEIITWSLERSGVMASQKGGWYFQSVSQTLF